MKECISLLWPIGNRVIVTCSFRDFRKVGRYSHKKGLTWNSLLLVFLFQRCCHFLWRKLFILGFRSVYGMLYLSGVKSKADFKADFARVAYEYVSKTAWHLVFIEPGWFMRWEVSGHTAVVLLNAASRVCLRQPAVSLCSFYAAFSPSVSIKIKRCNYSAVLTRLQRGRNPILFYQRLYFHIIDNLSIAVHIFPMRMFTSLSADKILLLRYIN